MRRRLVLLAGILICGGASGSMIAVAADVTNFREPDPSIVKVPPKGPGQDYKSNPAAPELIPVPKSKGPLSRAEKQRIWEAIDPTDSPNILVCVNDDGSGGVEFQTPAEPGAEAAPVKPGTREAPANHINDKGPC